MLQQLHQAGAQARLPLLLHAPVVQSGKGRREQAAEQIALAARCSAGGAAKAPESVPGGSPLVRAEQRAAGIRSRTFTWSSRTVGLKIGLWAEARS